ncbi:MAG: hypothetical protein FWD26_04925 [Treponema sp.]|nr:hypothetical protein [Treponema sp.]
MPASNELLGNFCKYSRFFHYLNNNFDKNQLITKNRANAGSFTKINASAARLQPEAILSKKNENNPGVFSDNYHEIQNIYVDYTLKERNITNNTTNNDRILLYELLKSLLEMIIKFNNSKYNEYNELCLHIQRNYLVNKFLDMFNYLYNSCNNLNNNTLRLFNELSDNDILIYGHELCYTIQYLGLNLTDTNYYSIPVQFNPFAGSDNPIQDFWNFIISHVRSINLFWLFNEVLLGNKAAQSQIRMIWKQARRQLLIDASRISSNASLIFLAMGAIQVSGVVGTITFTADLLLIIDDFLEGNYNGGIFNTTVLVAGFISKRIFQGGIRYIGERGIKISIGRNGRYYSLGRRGALRTKTAIKQQIQGDIANSEFGKIAPSITEQLINKVTEAYNILERINE